MSLPSYAPTTYLPTVITLFPNTNLNQEIALPSTFKDKQINESLSEIYSILTVLETVEKSYIKDLLNDKDKYTNIVLRLINQYNMLIKDPEIKEVFQSLESFAERYNIFVPLAISRLNVGVPASIENHTTQVSIDGSIKVGNGSNGASAKAVAETTGNFITCMDALKLNYRTKEQLHPLLSELILSINDNFEDFHNKSKIINWLIKLNSLGIDEELSSDEIKTFSNDLDSAYKGFYTSLE